MELFSEIYQQAAPYLVVAVIISVSISAYRRGAREPWLLLIALIAVGLAFVFPPLILLATLLYWLVLRARYPDLED